MTHNLAQTLNRTLFSLCCYITQNSYIYEDLALFGSNLQFENNSLAYSVFFFLPGCIKNAEKWCWSGKVGDTQTRPGNGQKGETQQQTGIVIMPGWPRMTLSSVQFSCSVMSNSLQPHESQHARRPRPSTTPRVYSNSCPSSR